MCGIAGIVHLDGCAVRPADLKAMTDAIAHRGPDGEGQWISPSQPNVGLGHRRLAIIDLSEANAQPMSTPDGQFTLTYNGELYNYRELRAELERLGHAFHTTGDTEVILRAWLQWGPDSLPRFNGMFAFAIHDARDGSLVLARDRYGIKPVYFSTHGSTFLFGSEQKAILAAPGMSREVDEEALLEYFTFQNLFTDRTLVKGVRILPAGTWLRIDAHGRKPVAVTRYWDFHFVDPGEPIDAQAAREQLAFLLRQAVERQLVSDVPIGAYLSGGMDSGTITALASAYVPGMRTFTIGFDLSTAQGMELRFDERAKAEAVARHFRTEQFEMILQAGDMQRALPAVTRAIEEPRVGQSYPNFYASELASRFVKVVLTGTGGDELFAGYPWRYYRAARSGSFGEFIDDYYRTWQRLIPNQDIKRVFAPIWPTVSGVWTRDIFESVFANHANELRTPADYVNHSLYFEAKTFLHGLLVVEDKLSMTHSLESRVPFLDNDLVDFAMACPVNLKLNSLDAVHRRDENAPGRKSDDFLLLQGDGKQILRDVMEEVLPADVTTFAKQGFSAPDASWFKGESIDFVNARLHDRAAPIYDYLDFPAVTALVDEHIRGERNRRLLIWSLLTVNEWLCAS